MTKGRIQQGKKTIPVLLLLALVLFAWIGLPGAACAQEETGKKDYVRTVESSPSLADMEKGEKWKYNTDYIYVLTRSVRDSSMPAGAKVVVFIPAFIADTAFLPVAAIFGLFGE